ncbi:hypothetical protein LAC81_35280 (plasmid) [Ensifer adhaerens]|nr:hypothetical protein LAC78_36580 [Ensifer adhaerens]UAY05776.1 hypothetical protein LAC80_35285 [Ensifer adhaerens]UAY13154.1 hypothetical protein LAC81_35280 [Ensifer adhaerens]
MWIYGEKRKSVCVDAMCVELTARLRAIDRQAPGLERHCALVALLLSAAELVEGVVDKDQAMSGCDRPSVERDVGELLLRDLATLVVRSWRSAMVAPIIVPDRIPNLLARLRAPKIVETKEAEGYAFYAVYPESYAEAAVASGLSSSTLVIGIRSIGASLSAMCASALGAQAPTTLRPLGHPFDRRVAMASELSKKLLNYAQGDVAIVDEGPGLSGSSFCCVAEWLEDHGFESERIHFFPSHKGGPGSKAGERRQTRWSKTTSHVRDLDDLLLGSSCRLAQWLSQLVGPLIEPLEDISAGKWRWKLGCDAGEWPPTDPRFERRKFLAHTEDATWLVKFAGLGETGSRKLVRARLLADKGFIQPVMGLCHGFLVQRWCVGRPLQLEEIHCDMFIEHLGNYLSFRTLYLPKSRFRGAPLSTLCEMAVANVHETMGSRAAWHLTTKINMAKIEAVRPVDIDGRLHRWEWSLHAGQNYLKADALDHSTGHDLIGFQDVAWDLAGACVEFDLSRSETDALRSIVSKNCGRDVNTKLQTCLEPCYSAFQLGLWVSARSGAADADVPQLEETASRYRRHLERYLT